MRYISRLIIFSVIAVLSVAIPARAYIAPPPIIPPCPPGNALEFNVGDEDSIGEPNYYVATDGDDNNPGTKAEPFRTIEKARDVIRGIALPTGHDMTVWLGGGTYYIDEPIVFEPVDSGTSDCNIVYQSHPGESAVINGGRVITDWESAGGGVYKVYLTDVHSGLWQFRQLFVNDERRTRARTPNVGNYHSIDTIINPGDRDDPINRTGFRFTSGDIDPNWTNLGDVEIINLFSWSEMRMPIDHIDSIEDIVYYTGRTGTDYRLPDWAGGRYFVENVYEGLDSPGEWYLNKETGWLYYWPMPGEDMGTVEVIAPVVEQLVRFEGNVGTSNFVEYITLKDLTFCFSDWDLPYNGYSESQASVEVRTWMEEDWVDPPYGKPVGSIYADAAKNCSIESCSIKHIGGWAIEFLNGCKDNSVIDSNIYDLGAGAIKVGEYWWPTSDAEEANGMVVSNNYIHDGGNVYLGAVGIWVGISGNNLLSHNIIEDLNYSGISVGWDWGCSDTRNKNNIIEYNHAHHLLNGMFNDGGGIYLLGKAPGTIVRNNIFHDIYGTGGLCRGIYLDQGSSYIHVENNIVYNTTNSTCFGHGENMFVNNIFVSGDAYQIWYGAGGCGSGDSFLRNIVYYTNPNAHLFYFYAGGTPVTDMVAESNYNVYYEVGGGTMTANCYQGLCAYSNWLAVGFDADSVVADPLFVDVGSHDFRLQAGSPALALGFNQIDTADVGVVPVIQSLILRLSDDGNDVLVTGRCEPWTSLVSASILEDGFDVAGLLNLEENGNINGSIPLSSFSTETKTLEVVVSDPDGDISEPGVSNTLGLVEGGSSEYVEIPYIPAYQLPVFTVSAWVYPTTDFLTQGGSIVSRGEDTVSDNWAFVLRVAQSGSVSEGVSIAYEGNGDQDYYWHTSFFPPINTWTHTAATRSSDGTLSIYINGSLHSQWYSTPTPTSNCFQNIVVGATWANTSSGMILDSFFHGGIDDVRIYDKALSGYEVSRIYQNFFEDTSNLIGHWDFEEGAGQVAGDSSIYGNDGQLGSTSAVDVNDPDWVESEVAPPDCHGEDEPPPIISHCPPGEALDFDGVDDYVEIPDHPSQQMATNQITVSAWIRLNSGIESRQARIVNKQEQNNVAWGFEVFGNGYGVSTGNQLCFHDSDGGSNYYNCISTTNLNPNQWYHVAATDESGLIKIYIDGQLDVSSGQGYGIPGNINSRICIGAESSIITSFFAGKIDDVRIYDKALSDDEVMQIYQDIFKDTTNLVGHWDFDEGEDQVAGDSSGNGNDGQLGSTSSSGDSSDPEWVVSEVPVSYYYVDDDANDDPNWGVPGANIGQAGLSDPNESGTLLHPFDSIQKAIDEANDCDNVVALEGVYSGIGNYDIDPRGKSIYIRSTDPVDPEVVFNTVIFPEQQGSGFYLHSGEDANTMIDGLTIMDGYSAGSGGGVYCYQSSPLIQNCIMALNRADYSGGAIALIDESNAQIRNCNITFNECDHIAAGIYSYASDPEITNCLLTWNFGNYSGALSSDELSNVNITNCTIVDNSAPNGPGGLECFGEGKAFIKNSILWNNGDVEILPVDGFVTVTYSDIQMDIPNDANWFSYGNINTDPLFSLGDFGDYHLQSACGRWTHVFETNGDFDDSGRVDYEDLAILAFYWLNGGSGIVADMSGDDYIDFVDYAYFAANWYKPGDNSGGWVGDDVTSPCIDAGDLNSDFANEPYPNGGVINMGAYGNTIEASKSCTPP